LTEQQENNGLLLDVREPAEVNAKPATNSINIPRGVLEMKLLEMCQDATKPIYIHCASGARATLSAIQLQRLGFENVNVITCGIDDVCYLQSK